MREQLFEYYERELSYMRQMGAEFAAKYPAVAHRLLLEPDRCSDPHVERLLESFAFLTARIHLRLDDDFPVLTEGILDAVYPHYLRPVPAMTVVEFSPEEVRSNPSGSARIPAGSQLTTKRTQDGVPCKFRTSYGVDLWPVEIEQCFWRRPEQIPSPPHVQGVAAVLRVVLRAHRDVTLSKSGLDRLAFYLAGERSVVLPLYELLCSKLTRILVRNPVGSAQAGGRGIDKPITLGASQLRPMGFAPEESLLPYSRRSFQGYRLLQEYFSLPEKFLFFELSGIGQALQALEAGERVELLFYFSPFDQAERMPALENSISVETLKLRCTPAINLFEQTADPIILSHRRHEYPISIDSRKKMRSEIFSVNSVSATNPSRRTSLELPLLYEHRFRKLSPEARVFWHAVRRQALVDEHRPSDVFLSLVDREGVMMDPDAEILTVKCTCTNHGLPAHFPFGDQDGDFFLNSDTSIRRIRALHRPTPAYAPPIGRGQAWNLNSQLSLNHLSLGEARLPALHEILRLPNLGKTTHIEKQISGILSLQSSPDVALVQSEFGAVAARGTRVHIDLDESRFAGGVAYLFAAILDHFLGLYVSMNSFSRLTVRTNHRREPLYACSPRAGNQVLT